jgi:hypothetical protein
MKEYDGKSIEIKKYDFIGVRKVLISFRIDDYECSYYIADENFKILYQGNRRRKHFVGGIIGFGNDIKLSDNYNNLSPGSLTWDKVAPEISKIEDEALKLWTIYKNF